MVLQTIALPLGYASALPPLAARGAHRDVDYTAGNAAGQWNVLGAEIDFKANLLRFVIFNWAGIPKSELAELRYNLLSLFKEFGDYGNKWEGR